MFHDEVEIEDFEYDEDEETYYYPCPCGDRSILHFTPLRQCCGSGFLDPDSDPTAPKANA